MTFQPANNSQEEWNDRVRRKALHALDVLLDLKCNSIKLRNKLVLPSSVSDCSFRPILQIHASLPLTPLALLVSCSRAQWSAQSR